MFYKLEFPNDNLCFLDPARDFPSPLIFEGLEYPNIWYFFFAMKTKSKECRESILNIPMDALQQYTLSYNKKFEIRDDWMKVKISVMDYALRYYFSFEENKVQLRNLIRIDKIYDIKCNAFWFLNPAGDGSNWYFKLVQAIKDDLTKGIDISKVTFKNNEDLLEEYKKYFFYESTLEKEAIAVNKNKEKCDVYVGRGSPFGNPFPVFNGEFTLEDSLRLHAVQLSENAYLDKKFRKTIISLKGKKLGCFCAGYTSEDERYFLHSPECHAQTIANLANSLT